MSTFSFCLSRSLWPRWISIKQLGADLSRMMTKDNPVGKGIEEKEDARRRCTIQWNDAPKSPFTPTAWDQRPEFDNLFFLIFKRLEKKKSSVNFWVKIENIKRV